MLKKISLVIALIVITNNMISQSNWSYVGPISNNLSSGSETGLVNNLAIDPTNPLHLFASSIFGGLWESTNRGANWANINTNASGCNGIKDIAFISTSKIVVGNFHGNYAQENVSYGLSTYDFISSTWTSLGALPLPIGIANYTIKSVAVHPTNSSILYACTSVGLYRSTDAGLTWTRTLSGCIENVLFLSRTVGYYCYAAGSTTPGYFGSPTGVAMLMESSDDGATFPIDLSSNITMNPVFLHSHSKIGLGPDDGLGNKTLFILTDVIKLATPSGASCPSWDVPTSSSNGAHYVHRIVKNINSGTITNSAIPNNLYSGSYGSPDRMALAYDPLHNLLWFGGVYLNYLNLGTYLNSLAGGGLHNDMHDLDVSSYGGNIELHVSCDGGIYKTQLNSANYYSAFSTINNGLNISTINGFSGSSSNPNKYSLGSQDITHVDIFDATAGTYKRFISGESDGTLIDKFNDNLIIMDYQSYDAATSVSLDGGVTNSPWDQIYNPKTTSPLEADLNSPASETVEFGSQQFRQDPYRPGRIYGLGGNHWANIVQFDLINNRFAQKNVLGGYFPSTDWEARLTGLSFSPQTPNCVYAITSARYYPQNSESVSSNVFKYIGPNFDDCWKNHNEYTDAGGNQQWQLITPNFANLSTIGGGAIDIPSTDLGKGDLTAIETSPWNKSIIYVTCSIRDNPNVKVIKYDGTNWTNYSTGIPANEYVFSMIMDHASNDGIYISTDKAIYFRDATMSSWTSFSNGYPILYSKQLEINYNENTVRAGTYGKGIYKSPLNCPTQPNVPLTGTIPPYIYEASNNITASGVTTMAGSPTVFRAGNSVVLNPGFSATGSSTANNYLLAFIHGCSGGGTNPNMFRNSFYAPPVIDQNTELKEEEEGVSIFPNPSSGIFTIALKEDEKVDAELYNINGNLNYKTTLIGDETDLNLSDLSNGLYLLQLKHPSGVITNHKIVILK